MSRLNRLDPHGFRGIRFSSPLNFGESGASAVIFGTNGRGKSSYVDAIEWYLTGKIAHLEKESARRSAYRHRAHPANELATVRLDFVEPEIGGELQIDADHRMDFIPNSESAIAYRQAASAEQIVLRHRDLSDFVDKTKTQKLEALEKLIGVEALADVRSQLIRTVGILAGAMATHRRSLGERRRSLSTLLGVDGSVKQWDVIHELLGVVDAADLPTDARLLEKALAAVRIVSDPIRDAALKTLNRALSGARDLEGLATELDAAKGFIEAFNALAADTAAIEELRLVDLWSAGGAVVNSESWTSRNCPLCGADLEGLDLGERIEHLLESAVATQARLDDLERDRAAASLEVEAICETLAGSLVEMADVAECGDLAGLVATARDSLRPLDSIFRRPLSAGSTLDIETLEAWTEPRNGIIRAISPAVELLTKGIDERSLTAKEGERLDAFRTLGAAQSQLVEIESMEREDMLLEIQHSSLARIAERFEDHERQTIERILSRISTNVTEYYESLHHGERYERVRLEFVSDRRGVEFILEAYGQEVTPPLALLSESHLNSLGLCLFLAAAREFNTTSRFLVLDDIVNSFDSNHRAQLAKLLVDRFDDFQVLAFTHDKIWFEALRRMGPSWRALQLAQWTWDSGVEVAGTPGELRARVLKHLEDGAADVAGNLARQLIEQELKRLCSRMDVLVPFRDGYENEQRTGDELVQAIRRHVKNSGRFAPLDHPVWREFGTSNFLTNLASHDQPDLPAGLEVGDIRFAVDKLDELLALFRCDECEKPVWHLRQDNDRDRTRCECGALEM